MRVALCTLLVTAYVSGAPLPLLLDLQASVAVIPSSRVVERSPAIPVAPRKLRAKRQWEPSWYTAWYNDGYATTPQETRWTTPPRNPFEICETPEGKKLGAQCSGGSLSEVHSDGWNTVQTDTSFSSWSLGDPSKPGWYPFSSASNAATTRAGTTVGGTSGSIVRTGGSSAAINSVPNNSEPINSEPINSEPINSGGIVHKKSASADSKTGQTTGGSTTGKAASGCLNVLGFATLGTDC